VYLMIRESAGRGWITAQKMSAVMAPERFV
jgi:hypothetical protein